MPLARFDAPFEHADWIFEAKLDGLSRRREEFFDWRRTA
jgi:hypothetical protein